jgi:hypothetical protein
MSDSWRACIRTRAIRTASVCHLCNITRQLGRRLKWDPEKELFPGDDEASLLLDRSRSKGWELPDIG